MATDTATTATPTEAQLTPGARRVLQAASQLFYTEGLHAVGVEAIAEAAGVTKKTLYDRFGSKDKLIAAYLRSRDERYRAWLADYVRRNAGEDARAGLLATFDALCDWEDRASPRGCAFVNAMAELPDPDHPGHRAVAEQKRWMLDFLTDLARRAGLAEPEELAGTLFLIQEGAIVAYGTGVPADALQRARRSAAALLAAADGG